MTVKHTLLKPVPLPYELGRKRFRVVLMIDRVPILSRLSRNFFYKPAIKVRSVLKIVRKRINVTNELNILVFLFLIIPWMLLAPASAQQTQNENPFSNDGTVKGGIGPRAPVKPGHLKVRISREICGRLTLNHKADADVAYRPGVDVRGNAVAPADLPGSFTYAAPDEIEFDLAFNPLTGTALDDDRFANTTTSVGRVRVDILTGKVTVNGVPTENEQTAQIEKRCREAGFL